MAPLNGRLRRVPDLQKGLVRAACVQMTSGEDLETNLSIAGSLIELAAQTGAIFVTLPETVNCMTFGRKRILDKSHFYENNPALTYFSECARKYKIWLLAGSITVKSADDPEKLWNRSVLFNPDGKVFASYDKIHLFDVDLPNGESYRESALFIPGHKAMIADTPFGRLGMSICYDVRFPQLYRALAKQGVDILLIPSAFTRKTGVAHWQPLLQARAIETGAFILAPAQTGIHGQGRETYGHSLIIDPWGKILADSGTEPGIIYADLDLSKVTEARSAIPSLQHDRDFHF